jgi:uncharacterized protein (DUF2062 family)
VDQKECQNSLPAGSDPIRAAVVVPTYNNDATLADVLGRIDRVGLPVIVVNDGSTDGTAIVLERWRKRRVGATACFVVTHPVNRGKAAALRGGFASATEAGFTHAVTIDSDGQLKPEEIPTLVEAASESPDAMVLGTRDDQAPDYPSRSRVGRRISNMMVRLESDGHVADSQCGFRVYPLSLMSFLRCRAERFAFETEVLTRASWAGCRFVEVPVTCRYQDESERVSHFRPWRDSWRSVWMHMFLVTRALLPWPHHRWERAAQREHATTRTLWQRCVTALNPLAAYRELRRDAVAGPAMAVALGIGVWIGNLPLYGLQTILGIYMARRLHVNTLAVLLGTQISLPPIGPLLIAAAIAIGHLLLHGCWPVIANLNVHALGWENVIGPMLADWAVGGVLIGFAMGLLTFFVSLALFRRIRNAESAVEAV